MVQRIIERLKSTSFWVSLISAVFLILAAFGVEIGDEVASNVINGVSSVLIMLGIATPPGGNSPAKDRSQVEDKTDTIQ